ncbi:unnamed protein product [Pseudo-nitzschia multistriata]|uniref:Uncharacterized protein n=1 Tax=Pseudo-nitzschia multistriata TaxID=183589 RepID=A0A448YWX2_9STRA|nr:unnamed protein product [Pseudo-nitzschia multistriata]
MVPSSTTKKKSVATKRNKNFKSTTSLTSKAKSKRVTKAKQGNASSSSLLSNRKQKPSLAATKAATKPTVLTPNWPVTSQAPRFPAEASALRPGSLLRNNCSGSDIQLARSACAPVNFEKGKGKFLLVFPGNFSFGGSKPNDEANRDNPQPSGALVATALGEDDSDKSCHAGDQGHPTPAKTTAKKAGLPSNGTVTATPTMGRIEGLRTSTPSFRIPFPHLKKSLVFPGKNIPTTSKYLSLSCSNKKKGTVQCKNIFSSAIVFGIPKWESSLVTEKEISISYPSASLSASVNDSNGESDEKKNDSETLPNFSHYGGSERTIDGAARSRSNVTKKNKNTSRSDSQMNRIPIWSNHRDIDDNSNNKQHSAFDFSRMPKSEVKAPLPKSKRETTKYHDSSSGNDDNDDSSNGTIDDDDSDASFRIGTPKRRKTIISSSTTTTDFSNVSATKTRSAPRRQASEKKKRYVEQQEETSDDDGESLHDEESPSNSVSEDDEDQAVDNKKSTTKKHKKNTHAAHSSSRQQKIVKNQAKGAGEKSVIKKDIIDVDNGGDDWSASDSSFASVGDKDTSESIVRRTRARRITRVTKQTSYKEINESDSEENDDDDNSESEEMKKNSSSKAKGSDPDKERQDKTKRCSASTAPRGRPKSHKKNASSGKRKPSPSRLRAAASRSKRQSIQETTNSSNGVGSNGAKLITQSPSSFSSPTVGAKSPFRRRHKKSSPAKKARINVLDLTEDDAFDFG